MRWKWSPTDRAVTALDAGAAALGHVEQAAPPRPAARPKPAARAGQQGHASSANGKPSTAGPPPAASRRKTSSTPSRSRSAAKPAQTLVAVVPPVDQDIPTDKTGTPAVRSRSVGRASVPAWADILLGAPVGEAATADAERPAAAGGLRQRRQPPG